MTYKKIIGLILTGSILTGSATETVDTQMDCDRTETIGSSLKNTYGELPIISGIANDEAKSLMTVWMNPVTKSWSIVATKDDLSCIIGVGEDFKVIVMKPKIKSSYKQRSNM
jgi:DNA recombination-dependent growth factor C